MQVGCGTVPPSLHHQSSKTKVGKVKNEEVSMECKLVVPHQGEGYGKVEVNRQVDPARQGCSPQDDTVNDSTSTSEGASTYLPTASRPAQHFSLTVSKSHAVVNGSHTSTR